VTRRCQLVKVVAAFDQTKISIYDGKIFFGGGGAQKLSNNNIDDDDDSN
jgi:hypothetical protein